MLEVRASGAGALVSADFRVPEVLPFVAVGGGEVSSDVGRFLAINCYGARGAFKPPSVPRRQYAKNALDRVIVDGVPVVSR